MIDINKIIENRAQRIMILAKITTEKIVKKELRKLKKDIIKEIKK